MREVSSTTLSWQTSERDRRNYEGIGAVQASGSPFGDARRFDYTYRLAAKGPGSTQEATARVTVTGGAPPPPPPGWPTVSRRSSSSKSVHDIYFDYDKYDLQAPDQQGATLQADAQWLAAHPNVKFTVEGHCDERGSTEYNLALGDNRANSAKQALVQAGVGSRGRQDHQLRQGEALLHREQRTVLAAESPCSLRLRQVRFCSAGGALAGRRLARA